MNGAENEHMSEPVGERFMLPTAKQGSLPPYYPVGTKRVEYMQVLPLSSPTQTNAGVALNTALTYQFKLGAGEHIDWQETHFYGKFSLYQGTNGALAPIVTDTFALSQLPIAALFKNWQHNVNGQTVSTTADLPQSEMWERRTNRSRAYGDSIGTAEGYSPPDVITRQTQNGSSDRDFAWFPKQGLFRCKKLFPGGNHQIILTPYAGYKTLVENSDVAGAELLLTIAGPAAATSYSLLINEISLYVAIKKGPVPHDDVYIADFCDIELQSQSISNVTAANLQMSTKESVVALGVFMQDSAAGTSNAKSITHYTVGVTRNKDANFASTSSAAETGVANTTGIPTYALIGSGATAGLIDQVETMSSFQLQYGGHWYPGPLLQCDSALSGGKTLTNIMRWYILSLLGNEALKDPAGQESFGSWATMGRLLRIPICKTSDIKSNNVVIKATFTAGMTCNLYLVTEYTRQCLITVKDGDVQAVQMVDR